MDEMKITKVYGKIYIVLYKDETEDKVKVFTDAYAKERFCSKVNGRIFRESLDSEDVPYGRNGEMKHLGGKRYD